mmetsp:Transcript_20612/g.26567  ORF Transcript_20612/g.26567 Transcript_20612/m.26567 type:complete len:300 (+) Transcript_20612:131-1030(+)|eukprot:CAMPEP_0198152156 /NCGR_PEP_ID=MMETSP1443-20131203/58681_1 /TAXON_ID=186043 /ORGANISM="Entomoneis sp., Strain CCMP2396" /LENGTH=299 /DNA_ID=CAMNT_0043818081 /DNA_START=122 /DNA_END=1021 /DNA_ORIENTATION=+
MAKKLTRTRTCLELRIGESTVIQVILLVQKHHLDWFNSCCTTSSSTSSGDDNDSSKNNKWTELYRVLEEQVIPRCLSDQIEDAFYDHHSDNKTLKRKRPPEILGPGGIAITTAASANSTNATGGGAPAGRRGGGGKKHKKLNKKQLKQLEQQEQQALANNKSAARAAQRPNLWAFGHTMQLAYKCETWQEHSATLVFLPSASSSPTTKQKQKTNKKDDSSGKKIKHQLKALETLSKRLTVACGPLDENNRGDANDDSSSLMMLQTEQIPITSLFRQRPENDDDDQKDAKTKRKEVIELE